MMNAFATDRFCPKVIENRLAKAVEAKCLFMSKTLDVLACENQVKV